MLREGLTADALAALAKADHLHVADNDLELYLGMLRRWWSAHQAGTPHPMVDRRHATRHVLNRLARQMLRANGELGEEEVTAADERHFAVGDRVVARMANRDLHVDGRPGAYVRNGASGAVVAVELASQRARDRVSVDFDDVGIVDLPRSFFDEHDNGHGRIDVGIDHAYAGTSHGVQGATFEESTSRIDEGATRSEAYVDITRGRHGNHLFLTRAVDILDGEHLPKAPPQRLEESVAERLRRSGPERAAFEFSPVGSPAPGASPPGWDATLPEPHEGPVYLRHRWRSALTRTAAYRSEWQPSPSGGAWGWALGSSVPQKRAQDERGLLVDQLEAYAKALAAAESVVGIGPAAVDESGGELVVAAMRIGTSAVDRSAVDRNGSSVGAGEAATPERSCGPDPVDPALVVADRAAQPRARQVRPRRR